MPAKLKHDWALIAHDYKDGASIQELCARYGLTRANLTRRIREDGWPQTPASPPPSSKSIDTQLAAAMEHSLALLEKRISEMGDSPSAEHEPATKSLIALARTICSLGQLMERREKLAQIAQANEAASRVNHDDDDDEADTEKLRADLARRLERLVAGWRTKQADETTA